MLPQDVQPCCTSLLSKSQATPAVIGFFVFRVKTAIPPGLLQAAAIYVPGSYIASGGGPYQNTIDKQISIFLKEL